MLESAAEVIVMEEVIKLELTEEEARARTAELDAMLALLRQANEEIAWRQKEIERLQAETWRVIANMKDQNVGSAF